MAAATADRDTKASRRDMLVPIPGKSSESFYVGTLGMVADGTGLLQNGADTASMTFAGVLAEAGTGDGSVKFEVYTMGEFEFVYSAGDAATDDIGQEVTLVDNQTVGLASATSNDVKCGRITQVISTTKVRILITGYGFYRATDGSGN